MSGNDRKIGGERSGPSAVGERRRALLKVLTASAGAYMVPMVASFAMNGLRIGEAAANVGFCPPGLVAGNQLSEHPQGRPFGKDQPPGTPFSDPFGRPGTPFVGNQYPGLCLPN
jgi:hypothetical protein